MAADDVPPHDMFLFGSSPDPLDAALRGGSDDPAVDALVSDVRSAYLSEEVRPRSAALTAFAGTGHDVAIGTVRSRPTATPVVEAPAPLGRRAAVAAAAFAATLSGKVVLGGAVAAAAIGGLHVTDTVDVPLLPRSPQAQTVPSTVPELPDVPGPLSVLVGPPAELPTDAVEGTPAPDVPARGIPAPAAPQPQADRQPATADDPAEVREGRTDPGTPPATPPPTAAPTGPPPTAGPPAPTTAQPDRQAPAEGAPKDADHSPSEADTDAGPPAGADREPPAATPEGQRTSPRP